MYMIIHIHMTRRGLPDGSARSRVRGAQLHCCSQHFTRVRKTIARLHATRRSFRRVPCIRNALCMVADFAASSLGASRGGGNGGEDRQGRWARDERAGIIVIITTTNMLCCLLFVSSISSSSSSSGSSNHNTITGTV